MTHRPRGITELENFNTAEVHGLTPEMRVKLQATRYLASQLAQEDIPLFVTSGLREDDGDGDVGEHETGEAVDVSDNLSGLPISSNWRYYVTKAAYLIGLTRVGTYDRHLHLGVSDTRPQNVNWTGVSQ